MTQLGFVSFFLRRSSTLCQVCGSAAWLKSAVSLEAWCAFDGLLVMAPRNADREKCVKALNQIAVGKDVDRKREEDKEKENHGPGTKIGLKF